MAQVTPIFELVKTLTEIPGPIGQEDEVHQWCARRWSEFADVRMNPAGNVVAHVGGQGPSLIVLAHGDELALIVRSITANGLLHVWPAWRDQRGRPPHWYSPVNHPVCVLADSGPVDGQLCYASGHVVGGARDKDSFEWDDWFVDLGYRERARVEALGIHPGTRLVANPPTRRLGDAIVGKAMDNRAAIAIATAVGERAEPGRLRHTLWIGSSVQEENGLLGAASIPDMADLTSAIVLDVGLCGDVPGTRPERHPAQLGAGPIVVHQDSSTNYSPRLARALVETAQATDIPVQQAVFQNYGSDGAELIRRGVETILLAFPTRYTHSPNEMVTEEDLEHTVELILAYLQRDPLPPRWPAGGRA